VIEMIVKLLLGGVCSCTLLALMPFIGPFRSGAWRLLEAAPLQDRGTNIITSVALTCPDRQGRSTTHAAVAVRPESEEWTKWDLVRTVCAWRRERWLQPR
jgi:hypothetical protein